MCCLRYEYDAYKDYKTRAPKRGALVETPSGGAKVTSLNTPKETVSMRLEDGTNVTVPLSSMECSKGSGCPCSVGREALEAAMGPTAIAVSMPEPKPRATESKVAPEPAPAVAESTGRKRRRRGKSAPEGAKQATAEKPAAQQPKAEAPKEGTADKPTKTPRRRRRRRPSGGSAGGES
jgi:hypothetical protein